MRSVRGTFVDFVGDPWQYPGREHEAVRVVHDGVLVIDDAGLIADFGPAPAVAARNPGVLEHATHIAERLILPGFVDAHAHMPQTRILGAYGEALLPWLDKWVFPEERKYFDEAYATAGVRQFFDNLLACGTTTVQAFTTAKPITTELVFQEAARRGVRVITGITAIDRAAPASVRTSAEQYLADSRALIERFHGVDRASYAITPRFALGATPELLTACGQLKAEHPDMHVHTHISETHAEIRGVLELYPDCSDYLAVYERYGLVGPRFTGGHGIWLSDAELTRLSHSGAALTFCPCSNLYLGSGLFRLGAATDPARPVRLGLGTDVGAGNRFSMLAVLDEAYKVGMLNAAALGPSAEAERNKLSWARAYYAATLGGARSLYLDDRVGSFDIGKDADFVALDWRQGPPGANWHASLLWDAPGTPDDLDTIGELLFATMMVGDDRAISETWTLGEPRYRRDTTRSV